MNRAETGSISVDLALKQAKKFLEEKQNGNDRGNFYNTYLGEVVGDRVQVMVKLPGNKGSVQQGWYTLTTETYDALPAEEMNAAVSATEADQTVIAFTQGSTPSIHAKLQDVLKEKGAA